MPPLLESDFGRLVGFLGFVVGILLFRGGTISSTISAWRALISSGICAAHDQESSAYRMLLWVRAIAVALLFLVLLFSIVSIDKCYTSITDVADSVGTRDGVVIDLLVRNARQQVSASYKWFTLLAVLLTVEYLLAIVTAFARRPWLRIKDNHPHPFELDSRGGGGAIALWEARRECIEEQGVRSATAGWMSSWSDWSALICHYSDAVRFERVDSNDGVG